MSEDVEAKTKDQLLAELKAALDTGDFKAVAKVSREIDKITTAEEKAEKDAKLAVVGELTKTVKSVIDKAVKRLIDAKELDACDGIWYSFDFGDTESSCRLLKGASKKGGGGSGGGKKFSITTTELLQAHGAEQMGDSGTTFQEAYDSDTGGNSRYKVRMKLLKAHGLS